MHFAHYYERSSLNEYFAGFFWKKSIFLKIKFSDFFQKIDLLYFKLFLLNLNYIYKREQKFLLSATRVL